MESDDSLHTYATALCPTRASRLIRLSAHLVFHKTSWWSVRPWGTRKLRDSAAARGGAASPWMGPWLLEYQSWSI